MTADGRNESALRYLSELQRTLVDASKQFIAVGADELDDTITHVLGQVGECCAVDRSYLFRFSADGLLLNNTHEWCGPGTTPQIDNLQGLPRDMAPRAMERMERREVVHVARVQDLPPDWDEEKTLFGAQDIQSLVLVPIFAGDEMYGFAGFDSVHRDRVWSQEEIGLLEVLGDLIGSVVEREGHARALRESEGFRASAERLAQMGSWAWNLESDRFTPSDEWRRVTGCMTDPLNVDEVLGLVHPDDALEVERKLAATIDEGVPYDIEHRIYRQGDGELRWIRVHAEVSTGSDHRRVMYGFAQDITSQHKAAQQLQRLAHYDPVTGLPNRILALDRLKQSIRHARRHDEQVAVLFLDLDHFKKTNDTLGHEAGDELLKEAAGRLLEILRDQDTVARFGGDEFLVIVDGLADEADACPVAEKILQLFREPFVLKHREFIVTASIGVAISPQDGDNAEDLLRNADIAMYQSKAEGRNSYHFFTRAMDRSVARRQAVEENLRGALSREELSLVFQPIVNLQCGKVVGAEALIRWNNPELGLVTPDEFIPIAEQTGDIDRIGDYVLLHALREVARWRSERASDFWVSVNVSVQQFRKGRFINTIERALNENGLPGDALHVEITESVLMDERSGVALSLQRLKSFGVSIAMDDFGTGYASLSYLRDLPFDTLKIDRSFVGELPENERDVELVIAAISLAHSLKLVALAEGVETEGQVPLLRRYGCELAQGYLFGKPMPVSEFDRLAQDIVP